MNETEFHAPWGPMVRWASAVTVALMAGVALIGCVVGPRGEPWWVLGVWLLAMVLTPDDPQRFTHLIGPAPGPI